MPKAVRAAPSGIYERKRRFVTVYSITGEHKKLAFPR
jgi:hypothetical protein